MHPEDGQAKIRGIEPVLVWEFFAGISAVPRPSGKEEKIREFVQGVAGHLGLACRADSAGNVHLLVPATRGFEAAPIVVLQGHMDMVCEKNSNSVHDFEKDPLRLLLGQDPDSGESYIRADGTTLGADNGIGMALALAAAASTEVTHGPLELLFTVSEETGMNGADQLSPDLVRGRLLLNLDTGDDDTLYIGCAGGCDTTLTWELPAHALADQREAGVLTISGLRGGHSGGDIDRDHGNAVRLLARVLMESGSDQLQLSATSGGSRRNAIAREARAVFAGPIGITRTLSRVAHELEIVARETLGEEACAITIAAGGVPARGAGDASGDQRDDRRGDGDRVPELFLSPADSRRLLTVLLALPHGLLAIDPTMGRATRTSNNVATVRVEESGVSAAGRQCLRAVVECMSRSTCDAQIDEAIRQISAVGHLSGADVRSGNRYPGWRPDPDSDLVKLCQQVYQGLFGHTPQTKVVHGGLECGILGARIPGMDMVSLGPRITGAHSPDERVWVSSVQKSWSYLTALLGQIARSRR